MLSIGESAPAFSLTDQDGTTHTLAEYQGSWVLLYFYPMDDTPGCTTEACGLRDVYGELQERGVEVLGVSADDQQSHAAFAEKYDLPFTLLADTERSVIETYDGNNRVSYLINPSGVIAKAYSDVKPEEHAAEILRDVDALTA